MKEAKLTNISVFPKNLKTKIVYPAALSTLWSNVKKRISLKIAVLVENA